MNTLTFRLDQEQFNWLENTSRRMGATLSSLIKTLLQRTRNNPALLSNLEEELLMVPVPYDQQRQELWYSIMSHALLELLVKHTLNEGDKLFSALEAKIRPLLDELGLTATKSKECRLTIHLEKDLADWVKMTAKSKKLTASQLLRNIIGIHYLAGLKKGGNQFLSLSQKEAARRSILTYALLKDYVSANYKDSHTLFQGAYEKARPAIRRLFKQMQEEFEEMP